LSGEARRRRIRTLLERSGAADVPTSAVEPAFVHESAAREGAGASNERLEFFGDAILAFVTARYLMRAYPTASEGALARRRATLASGDACAQTARVLGMGDLMILGHGLAAAGGAGNASVLADAFEAYLAALYAATSLEVVAAFIEAEHLALHDRPDIEATDAKTALQELTQEVLRTIPVYYERAEGPAHDRRFTSQVRVGEEILGEGIGSSKKAAQQSAAAMALAQLRERTPAEAPAVAASNASESTVVAFRPRRKPKPTPKEPSQP
jgi:ribonuclease-3